jgi:hypothetical protein
MSEQFRTSNYNTFSYVPTSGNLSVVQEVANLSNMIDALATHDAERARISKSLHSFIIEAATRPVYGEVLIVQTAGATSNGVIATERKIEKLIDDAVDDEVGVKYLRAGMFITERIFPLFNSSGVIQASRYSASIKVSLPKRILSLLNSQSQTERLQDLKLFLILQVESHGAAIDIDYGRENHYSLQRKQVIFRL